MNVGVHIRRYNVGLLTDLRLSDTGCVSEAGIKVSSRESHITALVSTALDQASLSGLSEMLKCIATSLNAYGCILWRVTPGTPDLSEDLSNRRLFALAHWLQDNRSFALHNFPLSSATGKAGSLTGDAILSGSALASDNIWEDDRVYKGDPFLGQAGIKTICSVPVAFTDRVRGAVNVYRTDSVPFTGAEIALLEELASLVPSLYQTIQDRVSLKLIRSVSVILQEAESAGSNAELSIHQINGVFQSVCRRVAETFQCVETSIFLENRVDAPDQFRLIATTWQGRFKKQVYHRNPREGLTGWVLAHGKGIRIFDLAHFGKDWKSIRSEYPGISWRDSLHFRTEVGKILRMGSDKDLPPLSFMASPIMVGEKIIGVIRCCTATKGPYFFSNRELNLLKLIAAMIAHYWSNWLSRREIQEENKSWRALIQGVSTLNGFVHKELNRPIPDEKRIFAEALRITNSVIRGAEVMDVRLCDEASQELYFAETYGSAWTDGDESKIKERRKRRFSVRRRPPQSAGALVFQTGKHYVVKNAETDPYYSRTFANIKRVIVAPISVENQIFGVLDIRRTADGDFPRHAEAIALLLGNQLGLYHYLANTIGRLRKAEADLKDQVNEKTRIQEAQAHTFEDLEHQFKSPIIQAYARVTAALSEWSGDIKLSTDLQAISGLCGKAKRVAANTGLFAKLASGEPIHLNLRLLNQDRLVKMLIQAASDTKVIIDPERNITFHVDQKTTDVLRSAKVEVDHDLLEQAINNLMDNASKYSFPRTRVEIGWGLTGTDRFHITVVNRGLPIRPDEVKLSVERGWRSGLAEATTGEGSGIGLWIVDNIMRAHGGELLVRPTTVTGITEVKLVFPSSR